MKQKKDKVRDMFDFKVKSTRVYLSFYIWRLIKVDVLFGILDKYTAIRKSNI